MKKYKFILFLFLIATLCHLQWFNYNSILSSSDWNYWPNDAACQLYNSYGLWINFFNFGSENIQLSFNFFTTIWSFVTYLGFSYDFATKITFLIPIAILGFIAPYVLFKKIMKSELIAFIIALFYGTTTHFLVRQTAHMPIAFVYALTPLTIYFFIKALEKNKFANWLVFVLVYWIGGCYEIRITYIVTFVLVLYFVFFHISNIKKYWKNILVCILLFISLNIYWLLSILFGGSANSIAAVANRGLFGNALFELKNSFTLSESAWTGGLLNNQFIKQPVFWYFWFIPLIAFASFLFKGNNKYKKEISFYGVLSLLGIFLTKQTAEPIASAYLWLYNNFPGFNLFREASKFYLVTAIGYAGLLGYCLLMLKEHKNKILSKYIFTVFSIILIAVSLLNVKPLITGEIGTMFVPRHISCDYNVLTDFILKQSEYYRTLWVPTDSRWGIFVNEKPKVSAVGITQGDWSKFVGYNNNFNSWSMQNQIIDILKKDFSNQLLDNSSIKYVIVPIQDTANDDDFFVYYGGQTDLNIRQWYIKELDKLKYLHKINIGTKDLAVYENVNYKDHLYATREPETVYRNVQADKVDWHFRNPTEYKISLKNVKANTYLNFSEKYHPDWRLHVGPFNWFKVLTAKNYFIDGRYHFENDAKLNSFLIDPEYIKQNFSKDYYKENPDGSIDVELTLYFKPQSYFYLGLIISGTTLFGCLGYLGWDWVRNKKRPVGEKQ